MLKFRVIFFLFIVLFFSGCATTLKKSPYFDQVIPNVKTIAVMPPDIEVYKLTAGGVRELIDEWSDTAKQLTQNALQDYFSQRYGFKVKFILEDWLKNNYKELWKTNQSLYNAVVAAALTHAYYGPNVFRDKLTNFDYTLGSEIQELAKACDADALLFINGVDHEATAGRIALLVWDIIVGAATGTTIIPLNPSFMSVGLIDAKSGDVEYLKVNNSDTEYSFINKKQIDILVEWLTRDFSIKK